MDRPVRYRVERHADGWHLVAHDTDRSVIKAGDRQSLIDLAESVIKDVGGVVEVDSHTDGLEAVIRHPGRQTP